ncbi:bleomycin resistance protein [Amycolatopsis anabasis]|uniref:bleomycin resistance protein n=1 Tax=Amycolatopsis anabasis TaxID=1840409 RepID=UPI00131AA6ED|nr:VOC family protein [Amycolatopsis anabasis]
MTETTIPILPCLSIDETLTFYQALGFEVTYRQARPNTYAAVRRGGIELQFFVLKQLDPTANWSTCYVKTDDVDTLYRDFTEGLRALLGKLPARGVPRVNPVKDLRSGMRQFVVVDPGGNYVRIGQQIGELNNGLADVRSADQPKLARVLETATIFADSHDDPAAAARLLDRALAEPGPAPDDLRLRALVLRADVAVRLGEDGQARAFLDQAGKIPLGEADSAALSDERRRIRDLEDLIAGGGVDSRS